MSKQSQNPGPVPSGNRSQSGTSFEEPGQDESGKTSAPQSPQGLGQDEEQGDQDDAAKPAGRKRNEPRPM